jgi:hypothetical protein
VAILYYTRIIQPIGTAPARTLVNSRLPRVTINDLLQHGISNGRDPTGWRVYSIYRVSSWLAETKAALTLALVMVPALHLHPCSARVVIESSLKI